VSGYYGARNIIRAKMQCVASKPINTLCDIKGLYP